MMITIDSLGPEGKRHMVVATTVVGIVLSVVTFALRSWARLSVVRWLYREDWMMAAALLLSLGFVICNFYGERSPERDHFRWARDALPLLRPLFRRFLDATSSGRGTSQQLNSGSQLNSQYRRPSRLIHPQLRNNGFERMGVKKLVGRPTDVESNGTSGSELELQDYRARNGGITIQTDIEMHIEQNLQHS